MARHKEDSGKAQAEVDRLLEILREMENEKNDKDKKINELERWVETCMLWMRVHVCGYMFWCSGQNNRNLNIKYRMWNSRDTLFYQNSFS